MNAAGFGGAAETGLPAEIVTAIEDCGFFESIPLWAVTLIGGLFIWVLSFVMILSVYSELLNSLDSGATTKITVNNHHLKRSDFEDSILMPLKADGLDEYREEYNKMLLDKSVDANGILQEKYVTVTVAKKNIEEARAYFARVGADLVQHFAALGSRCTELTALERLRILHDFYRSGEENAFPFDLKDNMRKGHCFRDYICPDSIEKHADYLKLGERYARVLYLKDYASYIKGSMVAELTDLNRNMMLSIDVIPIPTDEAVREVENRLLGVETNIANWQRRQNSNNNFSAVVPYDMELQRKEKEQILRDIFWAINTISHSTTTESVTTIIESDDGHGNILEETVTETKTTLHIVVSHKTAAEMAAEYGFGTQQLEHLDALLEEGTSGMWAAVLYGVYGADDQIVQVALTQVGNVGGEPYWSWYGFGSRVEWCACFVSWCADQCGYIDTGVIPKFAGCVNGVQWFRDRGQWADNAIEPAPGMIIFFDWDNKGHSGPQDGQSDHVGIVWKVEDGIICTVEGNSGDSCRVNQYPVCHYEILGYGIVNY